MTIELDSLRAREARLSQRIGKKGYGALIGLAIFLFILAAASAVVKRAPVGGVSAAAGLLCLMPALWWKRYLSVLPASGPSIDDRLSVDILARLKPGEPQNPRVVWQALSSHWQARFVMNHLFLHEDLIAGHLATDESALGAALEAASQLADRHGSQIIELGFVVTGLLATSPAIQQLLTQLKSRPADITAVGDWLARNLTEAPNKRFYGGVGRDWAFGFTPVLDRVGQNVSLSIMQYGAHFGWLTKSEGVLALETALANHAHAVALIGPEGIGKTTSVYALAQRMIEGISTDKLAYHQIVSLNATDIMSRARRQGDLEDLMLTVANEAAHAGHIILFLDNAELFFNDAPGAFDASHILLSIMESRVVPMILALSPGDYQRLKSGHAATANQLTPVVLQEQPEEGVMRILEDNALRLEGRQHVLITYDALREAYRLSGRYEQDEAYPGKAIKLLEQATTYAQNTVVTPESVQQAIEKSRGVKVSRAAPAEADALLHLEDRIHERMINQTYAVQAVASALRRARAGVGNPKRPIGSFLFLGPTGVGKTELAKSIAATYFNSEQNMIRLDMSEYQRPEDVQRLLATGEQETSSLILNVRQQPFSVVLLDEIEKAHPNILNLLLQLLDEGQLTDASGRPVSFRDCVIIATSNAGANTIRERVAKGEQLDSFAEALTDELISSGQFKPELLNRFDDTILFRPLTADELAQVVRLMLTDINKNLAQQNIGVELTDAAVAKIVSVGNDPRLGARPMRRTLQRTVEDTVAKKILSGSAGPGSQLTLDAPEITVN